MIPILSFFNMDPRVKKSHCFSPKNKSFLARGLPTRVAYVGCLRRTHVKNKFKIQPDKPDRLNMKTNMSGSFRRSLDKNLGNISESCTDNTEKPRGIGHLSDLSGPPGDLLRN